MLLVLLVVCVLLWWWYQRRRSYLEPPEYPGALPVLGHLHLVLIANSAMVSDPDDALTVANTCFKKNFMYKFAKPWVGNGLITASVPIWKQHRKVLNPTFSLLVLNSYMEVFNRQARRLVGRLSNHAGQGPFDHLLETRQIALETICMTAMGLDLTDDALIDGKYTRAVNEVMNIFLRRYLAPWLYFDFIYQRSDLKKKQDQIVEILHNVSDGLLELSEEHGMFTEEEMREHVDTIIVSGYETIASALFFTIILIGSYPRVQECLLKELNSVLGDNERDVASQDLPRLVYLEAVIKESMRVYTVVPIVARYIDRDVKLKKCTLLAGNTCYLSLYGIHRHSMWGVEAEEFRPERWLNTATLPDNANAFLAFSLGKRNCIGKTYAMMSLKTTLAHFLQRYKVTADHTKMALKMDILLKSVTGHEIYIEKRSR
ncbi:unnamed protein product, partial [Iphiclides podalirius]